MKVGKTDSLRETIITSDSPGRERKEGGRRRVVECNTGGLKSNRFPWTAPSTCTSVLASMKEGYTGDESTWIHRDDDYGRQQGGATSEFATERVASASGANRSNKLSSLKRRSGFAII